MRYSHNYPWQRVTRAAGVVGTCRIGSTYDATRMAAECEEVLGRFGLKPQFNATVHDGGWANLALVSAGGDPWQTQKVPGRYSKTPALQGAEYLEEIIDSFECEKNRVRLSRLAPGRHIFWHHDSTLSLDREVARLHLPIQTSPGAIAQISHEDNSWQAGELWYADFSFPHRVRNDGTENRLHLVIDLVVDDYVRGLFPDVIHDQVALRERAHETTTKWMNRLYTMRSKSWNHPLALVKYRARKVMRPSGHVGASSPDSGSVPVEAPSDTDDYV